MSKLQRFLGSDSFNVAIVKACVSSLPMWRYMRELERKPRKNDDGSDSSGLVIHINLMEHGKLRMSNTPRCIILGYRGLDFLK